MGDTPAGERDIYFQAAGAGPRVIQRALATAVCAISFATFAAAQINPAPKSILNTNAATR